MLNNRPRFFFLVLSLLLLCFFILAQLGPNGQFDSIELKVPMQAISGSVKAMVYVTGEIKLTRVFN